MAHLKRLTAFVLGLALLGCAASRRAQAQFLGYVSPQTVQQTLATNTTCTGSAQTFAINNLGQVQHFVSIANVTGASTFTAELDGLDIQGNVFRISDVAQLAVIALPRQGAIYGAGYFPRLQFSVTCSPGTATFTASYSGGWGTVPTSAGAFLNASIDKINFNQASATATQTDSQEQTPFGSSSGTLIFSYSSAPTSPGALSVKCSTNLLANPITALSVNLANKVGPQYFPVPDVACPFATVTYTPGTGGTVVASEYIFSAAGRTQSTDPCGQGQPRQSSTIVAAAAATTQIIAATGGISIYVCGYQMSQVATAGTLQWEYGTGASCGTGTTTLTGAMGVTASQPIAYGGAAGTIMTAPQGNALCLVTTGAGGTAAGIVTFVQSP